MSTTPIVSKQGVALCARSPTSCQIKMTYLAPPPIRASIALAMITAGLCGCSVPEYKLKDLSSIGGESAKGGTSVVGSGGTNGGAGGADSTITNTGTAASGGANNGGSVSAGGSASGGDTSATSGGSTASGTETAPVSGGNFQGVGTTGLGAGITTGGESSTGGVEATGGASPTGGMPSTATTSSMATGGAATGGLSSSGGAEAVGGRTNTGGAATGGAAAAGGVTATGGVVAAGGTKPTGGTSSVGGSAACASGYAFCDDFETYAIGSLATAWTQGAGTWSVVTETTAPVGDQHVYANKSPSNSTSQAGTAMYGDATIEARVKITSFSSTSSANAAGIFLRSNGTNDYDLALGADGTLYLRRAQNSSTMHTCSSGSASAMTAVPIVSSGCSASGYCTSGWFGLKLVVAGTVASGVTITAYVDATASGTYSQVFQCVQNAGTSYMIDSGAAGVFSKGSAQAEYDDILISVQ